MKRLLPFLLSILLLTVPVLALEPAAPDALPIPAPSAILMERSTGTVLYE